MDDLSLGKSLDDSGYPAYTMGSAADVLAVTPAFLRALGAHGLLTPGRSSGGHRRYSRDELELAARARDLVAEGLSLIAACRILDLEQQLAAAEAEIAVLKTLLDRPTPKTQTFGDNRKLQKG